MNDTLKKILNNGEEVLWIGKPEKSKLIDSVGGKGILTKWIICAVLGAALTLAYVLYCNGNSSAEFSFIMLVFTLGIPLAVAWGPVGENKRINKHLQYVVTDSRIILVTGDEQHFAMERSRVDEIKVRAIGDGASVVYFGTPSFKLSDKKLRYTALHGFTEHINGETVVTGTVFYNIKGANKVCELFAEQAQILPAV